MKKIIYIVIALFFIFPLNIYAISDKYQDKIYNITDTEVEEDKINIYLFKGAECPHCAEEKEWLKKIEDDYKDYINIYEFEVWHNEENARILDNVKKEMKSTSNSVPFTVVGSYYFVGFSKTTASNIENRIKEYAELNMNPNEVKVPILGKINMKTVSIPIVAIVLGFVDGFNPCAMWILLFLINMFLGQENKKKSWILGFTFLFISGLIYFLSMLGINLVLSVVTINWLKIAIAIFILIAGILNFRKYLKTRKEEDGCTVVDSKKRKKLSSKVKQIMESKSFLLSLIGVSLLAASVNLIELACSLGFPMIFTELLTINHVEGIMRIIYLLIYICFYMIDDMAVFTISMITLEATGITNKYNKLCTLVSAIIMIIMGILLLLKPDWLMLNF